MGARYVCMYVYMYACVRMYVCCIGDADIDDTNENEQKAVSASEQRVQWVEKVVTPRN